MKKLISTIINWFFHFFKIQDKIVFECGRGLIDGNPKAIYEYMLDIKQKKYKLIWLVEKGTDTTVLRDGDYVYYHTIKSCYHLATAKYWIRSQSMGSLLKKRKGQVYIQLWHGNGAMKYVEYDITNAKERPVLKHASEWDYYIANDELDASHMITGVGYDKKIEILGMACLDTTLKLANDSKFKQELLTKLSIEKKAKNKKLIFYAPTFRDFDLEKNIIKVPLEKLSKLKDYLILVRLHPLVRTKVDPIIFKNDNMINVCNYPDASDILAISDILITDYSSIFYQFSPLNRPIIFYAYDYDEYKKLRGGFYLDFQKDLPGEVCYTEDELVDVLSNIEEVTKKYQTKLKQFNSKYNYLADGNASKRFTDKLLNNEFNSER